VRTAGYGVCKQAGELIDVCHGRLTRPGSHVAHVVPVSLRVLHELTSDAERREFLATADKMAALCGDNVEQLEGVVSCSQTPFMIVTELACNGTLLDLIRVRFTEHRVETLASPSVVFIQRNTRNKRNATGVTQLSLTYV